MAESIACKYIRLFEVHLLHHYWLDDGLTLFDQPHEVKSSDHLRKYDVRSFLEITPTVATAKKLSTLKGFFKPTALGFMVAAPAGTKIHTDTVFEFVVTVLNADFFSYTALTLRPQKIYELYHESEKITYRYKENVPVFSNVTGVARNKGSVNSLFLSRATPQIKSEAELDSFKVEEFLVIEGDDALYQLTMDKPDPGTGKQQLGKALDLPVFFNQVDVPDLIAHEGLTGVPLRGIRLTDDIPDNVFALVRLSAECADEASFSFIDLSIDDKGYGYAKSTHPTYQVRFKSRSTFWKHIKKDNTITFFSKPLPLTFFGNAIGTKQKPSNGVVKAVMNDERVTQLFSEIFI
jgi:hypothetical protein